MEWSCPTYSCTDGVAPAMEGPCGLCGTHQCQGCVDQDHNGILSGEGSANYSKTCAVCQRQGCYHCLLTCETCIEEYGIVSATYCVDCVGDRLGRHPLTGRCSCQGCLARVVVVDDTSDVTLEIANLFI